MGICEEAKDDVDIFLSGHQKTFDIALISLFAINVLLTLAGSYDIFCRRSAHQRPLFVSL